MLKFGKLSPDKNRLIVVHREVLYVYLVVYFVYFVFFIFASVTVDYV